MTVYSYVIEHDYGFAPNPFHGVCTLAGCKPDIRKAAKLGDVIIGTAASSTGLPRHMVYWMRVDEITDFATYSADPRFQTKRPDMMAPGKLHRFGDNIYYPGGPDGALVQSFSFHSRADGSCNEHNYHRDTAKTHRVLIGREFAYYGVLAREIPHDMLDLIKKGPGHKCRFALERAAVFAAWATQQPDRGFIGKPTHWSSLK